MALGITALTSGSEDAGGSSIGTSSTTASFTTQANRLNIIFVTLVLLCSTNPSTPAVAQTGATWDQIATHEYASDADGVSVTAFRAGPGSNITGAATIFEP